MTLKGILIAEIACRGLWKNVSGQRIDVIIDHILKVEDAVDLQDVQYKAKKKELALPTRFAMEIKM